MFSPGSSDSERAVDDEETIDTEEIIAQKVHTIIYSLCTIM